MKHERTNEPAPDKVSGTGQERGQLDGPPPDLWTYREITDEAKRRTIESGALKVTDELLREVVGHADAIARERYRGPFSPQKNPHDAIRQEEFQRQHSARAELEQARKFRLADLQDAEASVAKAPPPGSAPKPSSWLVMAALLVFAVSVAPTFRDFIFHGIQDDVIAWVLSIAVGTVVGGLIVSAVLFSTDPGGGRTITNIMGLAAGGAIALGLLVLRLTGTESMAEALSAIGLAVVEIGALVYVEIAAMGLRPRHRDWEVRRAAHEAAAAGRDDIRRHVVEMDAQVDRLRREMIAHGRYVEERNVRHSTIDQVAAAAGKAAADGVAAGVAANLGRVLGIRRAG